MKKHTNEDLLTAKNLQMISEAQQLQEKREMTRKTNWQRLFKEAKR